MPDESDDPAQILNQFKAVSKGFEKAQHLLLDEAFRKAKLQKRLDAIKAEYNARTAKLKKASVLNSEALTLKPESNKQEAVVA